MKNLRLQNKILFFVVGLLTLLGALLVVIVRPILFEKLAMELSEKGEFMSQHMAHMSSEYIIRKEPHQLQIALNDFMTDDNDLIYSFVKGSDGEILAHSFTGGFPTALKNINPYDPEEQHIKELIVDNIKLLDVVSPIMKGDLGEVHIGLSERVITKSANAIVQTIFFIIAGILALSFVGAFFMARYLAKPLNELIDVIKEVAVGKLSKRVTVRGSDEIGQLGEAFNRMINELQTSTVSKERFQEQSEFLQEIVESIPYPFYVINPDDYSVLLANSATASRADWVGATCYRLTHQSEAPCGESGSCLCPLEEVKRTGKPVKVEHIHFDKNGEERFFEVHGYPVLDKQGKVIQMIEYSMDITDRKQAEAEVMTSKIEFERTNEIIEENRAKLQYALDEISALIQKVIKEKMLDVRFNNPVLQRCYEVMNCSIEECPCHTDEALLRCWQVMGTFCGTETSTGSFVEKFENCTDCPVFMAATSDPIYLVGEHFNNMMHLIELKNAELEEAYTELKSTHSQLLQQEKMASIGQLAAGVAHEINNPMGFITSNLSSLSKYVEKLVHFIQEQKVVLDHLGDDNEQVAGLRQKAEIMKVDFIQKDIVDLIEESLEGADRVKKIVMNLKSFSRMDEAKKMVMTDINECIENTLTIAWNELKYKTTVSKDYGELPLISCFPMQLNQVFMNILVNGSQSIEKQGEIHIRTWKEDESVYVTISDTGSGIPAEIRKNIFDPFFTTKRAGKGTGLGMSIAYDIIVKKHKGDIWVDSEVGKGSTFSIKLPIARQEEGDIASM